MDTKLIKYIVLFCASLISNFQFSIFNSATAQPLGPGAFASVLTCGPGNDFYTSFGHSALRICDSSTNTDVVYNYGTFDFGTPHFYWKFMRGQLDYCLSRTSFDYFLYSSGRDGREAWEQRLALSTQEVNNLFVLLEQNYLPEYRYYRYDFFRDNCATRVRDMVEAACGKGGKWSVESGKWKVESGQWKVESGQWATQSNRGSPLVTGHRAPTTSYRRYLHEALRDTLEWWALGTDLLLGLAADHRCTRDEAMFYPIVMMRQFGAATRNGQPFVTRTTHLVDDGRTGMSPSFPPVVPFALAFAVTALLTWRRRNLRWLDRTLFTVAGLMGLFLLFMWFGTDHYCTAWNLNILWASPLLLLVAVRLERSPRWALWLQEGCFAVAAVWVPACGLSPALVPIIVMLALRVGSLLGGAGSRASLSPSRG